MQTDAKIARPASLVTSRRVNQYDCGLSPIGTYYTVAFTMSMLARYRLSDWLAIWRGEKGDSASPLFEQVMALIQTEFPQLCAHILDDGNL